MKPFFAYSVGSELEAVNISEIHYQETKGEDQVWEFANLGELARRFSMHTLVLCPSAINKYRYYIINRMVPSEKGGAFEARSGAWCVWA